MQHATFLVGQLEKVRIQHRFVLARAGVVGRHVSWRRGVTKHVLKLRKERLCLVRADSEIGYSRKHPCYEGQHARSSEKNVGKYVVHSTNVIKEKQPVCHRAYLCSQVSDF